MIGVLAIVPSRKQILQVLLRISPSGPTHSSWLFVDLDLVPGNGVSARREAIKCFENARARLLAREDKGFEIVGAEILSHAVRGARLTGCSADVVLGGAEEALQLVGGGWNARVIVAVEQLTSVALGDASEMVDELPGGRAEPAPWSLLLHTGDEFLQSSMSIVPARRGIFTIRVRRDLASDVAKKFDVA